MGGRKPETITPIIYLPTVAGGFVSAIAANKRYRSATFIVSHRTRQIA
ncbi:hypothetical protein [Nostoc sp.]